MNISDLIAALEAAKAEHGDGRVTLAEVSFMEGTHQLVRLRYVGSDGPRQATSPASFSPLALNAEPATEGGAQ